VSDNKYGRVFTESDVEKIFEWIVAQGEGQPLDLGMVLESMDDEGVRFKFDPDEPIFILRGHDRRAIGAIKHYQEHQSARAPHNHTKAIDTAYQSFLDYREQNPGQMKEPN
jgi:hypothetical protein